jgi:hypothetical protein
MTGKQKTTSITLAAQKQSRLEKALRANLERRKAQARARAQGEKPPGTEKQPDESLAKR